MEFIHAVDPKDWYVCHNLLVDGGRLRSPNAIALVDAGIRNAHTPVETCSLDQLAFGRTMGGVVSPRAAGEVIRAGILRGGAAIFDGRMEQELISESTKVDAVRCSDVELIFEGVRREVAPNAASRLSCLYLAERTDAGERMLHTIFGAGVYILNVKVELCLSLTRVDMAWFDSYFHTSDRGDARSYWLGHEMPGGAMWEYLLDGVLQVEDPSRLAYLQAHGAKV